jgi:uncharacterized protein YbaR (Trm112 family)
MTEDTSTFAAAGLDRRLLDILACPICKGPLVLHPEPAVIVCRADRLAFPLRDGVPVMLEEEARTLAADDPLLAR